jgi:hypothetical protein
METECASCEIRTGLSVLLQVTSISQLTVSRLSRQCGILNISQPYRPPRPVTAITWIFFFTLYLRIIQTQTVNLKLNAFESPGIFYRWSCSSKLQRLSVIHSLCLNAYSAVLVTGGRSFLAAGPRSHKSENLIPRRHITALLVTNVT